MAKATTMGPMKIKESGGYRVFKVFNAIILTLISVAMLYPFLYLIAQSFSSTQAIVAGQVGLIPKDFNISTYKYVITDGKFIPCLLYTSFQPAGGSPHRPPTGPCRQIASS